MKYLNIMVIGAEPDWKSDDTSGRKTTFCNTHALHTVARFE